MHLDADHLSSLKYDNIASLRSAVGLYMWIQSQNVAMNFTGESTHGHIFTRRAQKSHYACTLDVHP